MTDVRTIIDDSIRSGLWPVLQAGGFRKTARTFRLAGNSLTRIVNVQASHWGTHQKGQFTINLGVYFPEVAVLHDLIPVRNPPRACDCIVQERIGRLMPFRHDHWWDVSHDSSVSEIASEMISVWGEYAKPWLERHSDLEAAQEFVTTKYRSPLITAMFSLARGNFDEASGIIRRCLLEGHDPDGRIARWAAKHHLNL